MIAKRKKPPKPQPRGSARTKPATEMEMMERAIVAMRLHNMGLNKAEIMRRMMKDYGLTSSQVKTTLAQMKDDLSQEYSESKAFGRQKQVNQLEYTYACAMAAKQFSAAVSAQNLLSHILGTRTPETMIITGDERLKNALVTYVAGLDKAMMDKLAEEGASIPKVTNGAAPVTNGHANGSSL